MKQVRRQTMLNIGVASDRDAAAKLLEKQADVETVAAGTMLVVTMTEAAKDYSHLATPWSPPASSYRCSRKTS